MSWKDKAALAVRTAPRSEPTKPTEAPCVSSVSAYPADISRQNAQALDRKARVLAYLEAHPGVKRACFADLKADPEHVILTVAVRDPWGAVELAVKREKFDPLAIMELSLRYPDTALQLPQAQNQQEH